MHLSQRAFILRNTRLQSLPAVPDLRLHLADDIMVLWQLMARESNQDDIPLPYWAVAWVGGQAVAKYLYDHPEEVTGKRVLDYAAGSGLCAIAALRVGALQAMAADIDSFSGEAIAINAETNGVSISYCSADLLNIDSPTVDLVLAGDIWYEKSLATRALPWLQTAAARGIRVITGDADRSYFPREHFIRLAGYEMRTTRAVEGREFTRAGIYTLRASVCRL